MNTFRILIFTLFIKGVLSGQCFQCDSSNYASCTTVTCPSDMCQTRTAMNGMVSHMCWGGSQTASTGCTIKYGEKICVCRGDKCNDAGTTSSNGSNGGGGNTGNTGSAGWGSWGQSHGMSGNNSSGSGWGNVGNGRPNNAGNWKDWGNNQAQNGGTGNGHSAGNNRHCNGTNTDCDKNGSPGIKAGNNLILPLMIYALCFLRDL